jgi:hypothetical protein
MTRALGCTLAMCLAAAAPALAQTPAAAGAGASAPLTRHWSFDLGVVWLGPAGAGTFDATYTTPTGNPATQFSLDKSIGQGLGGSARLARQLSPRVSAEVTGSWLRPEFRTRLSDDVDDAADATARQRVDRFTVVGGATIAITRGARWQTFARGGAGWLRELSDDQTLYADGLVLQAGGGAMLAFGRARAGQATAATRRGPAGLRFDVWLDVRRGGLEFAERRYVLAPAASVAFVLKL